MTDKPVKPKPEVRERLNWNSIRKICEAAAETMGHDLSTFDGNPSHPSVKTAMCETCQGCCWIAYSPSRGFSTGGRLLKYRCGTPGAAGLINPQEKAIQDARNAVIEAAKVWTRTALTWSYSPDTADLEAVRESSHRLAAAVKALEALEAEAK